LTEIRISEWQNGTIQKFVKPKNVFQWHNKNWIETANHCVTRERIQKNFACWCSLREILCLVCFLSRAHANPNQWQAIIHASRKVVVAAVYA